MEDLYGDGPDQAAGMNSETTTQAERDKETEGKTAQLNSEICPGMKPGDQIVLRITAVNQGEYTVAYEPSDEGKGQEEEAPPSAGMAASEASPYD